MVVSFDREVSLFSGVLKASKAITGCAYAGLWTVQNGETQEPKGLAQECGLCCWCLISVPAAGTSLYAATGSGGTS